MQPVATQIVENQSIKRLYYSISEVSQLVDEEQYVLRYWETEFEQLRPQKNRAGNRIYIEKDVELLRTIKHLLRDKRYTIDGAKEYLRSLAQIPHVETFIVTPAEHNVDASADTPANTPSEAASGEFLPIISELPTNGQHSEYVFTEIPEEFAVSIIPSIIPPNASIHELSHDELLQMRDTLREVLHLLDVPQNTPYTS